MVSENGLEVFSFLAG